MAGKPKGKEKKKPTKRESAVRPDLQGSKETLLLWAILGEGGGKDVSQAVLEEKGMLPGRAKKARDGLVRRGIITVEDHKTLKRGRRGIWMTVTEVGLTWAEENLAAVPAKLYAAAPILKAWLARVSVHLQAHKIPIAVFLEPHRSGASYESGPADPPAYGFHEDSPAVPYHSNPLNGEYDALRVRIRQAYLAVTGNRINTRARLRDIRQKLNDIDSSTLDAALKRMQREQQAILYALDNKAEITEADRSAAIYLGSEPCHILWIER
jgi:hypothetical protein